MKFQNQGFILYDDFTETTGATKHIIILKDGYIKNLEILLRCEFLLKINLKI